MSQEAAAQLASTQLVGISLSSSAGPHARADGEDLTHRLTSAGFGVRTDYAGADPGTQVAQVRAMLDDGADALVVGAVDDAVLTEVLAMAHAVDVPVVALAAEPLVAQPETQPGQPDAQLVAAQSVDVPGRVAVVAHDAPGRLPRTVASVRTLLGERA
jgi:ABC-type sugar transport system substrate-binding protein